MVESTTLVKRSRRPALVAAHRLILDIHRLILRLILDTHRPTLDTHRA